MTKRLRIIAIVVFLCPVFIQAQSITSRKSMTGSYTEVTAKEASAWEYFNASDNSRPSVRHECSYVEVNGKFYLIGGRGNPQLNIFDPVTRKWSTGATIPGGRELHHFQAVNFKGKIYIMGAFTGGFPYETPVADIYIYDPSANSWQVLTDQIPSGRRRGAAGTVVYNNRIYLVGGIKNGHADGWVNWLDEFDPERLTWQILPDAPHMRDHFNAIVFNQKIYAAGGRRSSYPNTINITEPAIDVFDFNSRSWVTLPASANIPTPRAGTATVLLNNEIVVIAGESGRNGYHRETEAFNPATNTWRTLPYTIEGRNGPGGISYNGNVYIVAGVNNGNEVYTQEILRTDDNPSVIDPIKDISVLKNAQNSEINLSAVFTDNNGAAELSYSVSANSNPGLVAATLNGSTLILEFQTDKTGTASIKIRATDQDGGFAEDEFRIDVNEDPGTLTTIRRINAGGNSFTFDGQKWETDQSFTGGSSFSAATGINGTENDLIYQSERYGSSFEYKIPLSPGTYTIKLHFAEIYWTAAGKRIFNLGIENGNISVSNLDIFAAAGGNTAYIKTFPSVEVTDGTLDITFTAVKDNAKVSGIEILSANTTEPVNQAPVANAGHDQTISLPTNTTTLSGSGTDDKSILTYEWTQVSGPATANISDRSQPKPVISGLLEGNYVFSLLVTDNEGKESNPDQVSINVTGQQVNPAITFTLVNAQNDQDILAIKEGTVIDLSSMASTGFNIRVNSTSQSVTNVEIQMNGAMNAARTESAEPYALFGDDSGDYHAWAPLSGNYTITAKVNSNSGSTTHKVSFSITTGSSANKIPVANAGADQELILPVDYSTLKGSGMDTDGTVKSYSWTQLSGPSTAFISNRTAETTQVSGLQEGIYRFGLTVTDDDNAQSITDEVEWIVKAENSSAGYFTLIDAISDKNLQVLKNGDIINLNNLPNTMLNISYTPENTAVNKVSFQLSGTRNYSSTESVAPYALFGDNNGNFYEWTPSPGNYVLKATPVTGAGNDVPVQISFSVNQSSGNRSIHLREGSNAAVYGNSVQKKTGEGNSLSVYPNPARSEFNIRVDGNFSQPSNLVIYNNLGNAVQTIKGIRPGTIIKAGNELGSGIYFIHLVQGSKISVIRVMKL